MSDVVNERERIAGLLLAAGASRRLGVAKQLLPDADGVPLVVRAARQLLDAGCRPVVVVTGARAREIEDVLREGLSASEESAGDGSAVVVVYNADFADGMGRSIGCGVAALAADPAWADAAAVLIAACDMPTVTVSHLVKLLQASDRGSVRAASGYMSLNGLDDAELVRGIPAVLPRVDWEWLAALEADHGAKPLLIAPETVVVPLTGGAFDLDAPADVAAWRAAQQPGAPRA